MATVDVSRGLLPPGQTATRKFPVVGERRPAAPALDLERWRLVVDGLVERPLELRYDEVLALPQGRLVADVHCVTGWSHLGMRLDGTPLATLLERARPEPAARFVRFVAHSPRDHDTTLPLSLARAGTWLIHGRDGRPLEPEHGFPLRTVTPSRYFYKSLKWLRRIELLADDRPGYWERESSYHPVGDPWPGDQRFATGSIDPNRLERFKKATRFAPFRGPKKALIGVDLRGWRPRARELGALHLKGCDLRDARLAGVDLAGANLSLCDLRGADLSSTDLRGADLEGVDFSGADLSSADLEGALLSATRFHREEDGRVIGARVTGIRLQGATGLLESEAAYLERAGVRR